MLLRRTVTEGSRKGLITEGGEYINRKAFSFSPQTGRYTRYIPISCIKEIGVERVGNWLDDASQLLSTVPYIEALTQRSGRNVVFFLQKIMSDFFL